MRIFFSKHALERMKERWISIDEVEFALAAPDVIRPGQPGTTVVERSLREGHTLRVFVKGGYLVGAKAIIITVAWKER